MISRHRPQNKMIKDLQKYINELGRLPLNKEIDNNPNILNCSVYSIYFGGVNNVFNLLEYDANKNIIALHLSNNEIIDIYKNFIENIYGIPSFNYCGQVYNLPSPSTVLRRFKCKWNEFIKMLGYEPNIQTAKATIKYAYDGARCLSTAEYIIHNFLLMKNIDNLQKEVYYKDILNDKELIQRSGYKRLDWVLTYKNKLYYIEYFGMMSIASYKKNHDEKLKLIEADNKMDNFIALYPKDLNKLDIIFKFILDKKNN